MRTAIVHSEFVVTGGIERVPLLQTLFLRRRGVETDCYATAINPRTCHPSIVTQVAPRSILPRIGKPILGIRALNHVLAVALCRLSPRRLRGYEVLQAHYQPAPWICYFAHKKYGTPYTHYAHGICRELYPRGIDIETVQEKSLPRYVLRKLRFWLDLDRESVGEAALCFANSRYTGEQMKEIYKVTNISVLYPGVDTQCFRPMATTETKPVVEKYGIQSPFVLTSNKHIGYKRIEWLIEMMPLILSEVPQISLVVVGSFNPACTPRLLETRARLNLEDKVSFLRCVDDYDLAALYNCASVYAFSPPDEDFGLGPVEAMCCGTPPVAWDAGGPRETIICGENGLLARPYDRQDFASKCLKVITDPSFRSKLSSGALAARTRFSWEAHVSQLIQDLFRLM